MRLIRGRCSNGVISKLLHMYGWGPMKKRPVQLTVEEESAREKAMDFYRYVGKTDVEATRLAWADLQKTFPRLRAYDSATEVPK